MADQPPPYQATPRYPEKPCQPNPPYPEQLHQQTPPYPEKPCQPNAPYPEQPCQPNAPYPEQPNAPYPEQPCQPNAPYPQQPCQPNAPYPEQPCQPNPPYQPTYQPNPPYQPTYQPYQSYPQAPPPQGPVVTAVVTGQPALIVAQTAPVFRDYPVTITDSRGQQVQTVLRYRAGYATWIIALMIFMITLMMGFCCLAIIPFFIKDLKDVYHINPTDGTVVGVYKRWSEQPRRSYAHCSAVH